MSTRKQLSRAQLLSQFFTNPDIARKLVKLTKSKLKEHAGIVWHSLFFIEPSAGDGAFSDCLPKHKTRAVEVDPELLERHPEFIGADLEHGGFLGLDKSALNLSGIPNSRILCIGNPPFSAPKFTGRSRCVALEFFNKAAEMADFIAFIVGNTFRRPNTVAKLNPWFHCLWDQDLPQKIFSLDKKDARVTTVFQIWKREESQRQPDPFLKLVQKGGHWGGPWRFVKSVDPNANIRVLDFGSHNTVGRLDQGEAVRKLVQNNQKIFEERKSRHAKTLEPDNSHSYIAAQDPDEVFANFASKRYLFKEVAQDLSLRTNPDFPRHLIVRIYLAEPGTHYQSGRWIPPQQ